MIWNSEGKLLRSFQAHAGGIQQVQFSPDGQRIASASEDGRVRLWDLRGRKLGEFVGHQDWIRGLDFAPNGEFLITGSSDNTARIWKVESLEDLLVRGCDWLDDYLVKTPLTLMELEVCQTEERVATAVPELVKHGETIAKARDVDGAIAIFQTALAWNPELNIDPKTRAEQFQLIGEGETLAQAGEAEQAIDKFWNQLCWDGSLQGYAEQVFDACHQAVALDPKNGGLIDSRGLARALTGDIEGAIADFQYFIEWTDDEEARSQRQQWIEALKAGDNPFTPEVLERLR